MRTILFCCPYSLFDNQFCCFCDKWYFCIVKMKDMKKVFCAVLCLGLSLCGMAQNKHNLGLKVGFGQSTYDAEDFIPSSNSSIADGPDGNYFFISGEYDVFNHLSVDAGLYYEENTFFTDFSSGTGLKKYGMLGPQGGMKFYFFPSKWFVQPYVGAGLSFNLLNLSKYSSKCSVITDNGERAELDYSGQAPFLSLEPRLGVVVYIFRSIALTLDYEYRYGLNGSNFGKLIIPCDNCNGQRWEMYDKNRRQTISIGLEVDFPYRKPKQKSVNNLMYFLFNLFSNVHSNTK